MLNGLVSKSVDWFLYDRDFCRERVKLLAILVDVFWISAGSFDS